MGSSKKKHKEKDREHRHRSKSSSSKFSTSRSLSFDAIGNNSNYYEVLRSPPIMDSTLGNLEQTTFSSSVMAPPKPPPLRMVLKVPQLPSMLDGAPIDPASVDFISSLPQHESANIAESGCSPFASTSTSFVGEGQKSAFTASPPLLSTISMESISALHNQCSPSADQFNESMNASNELRDASGHHSKKSSKKSKKSKKSKHKKHKHHRHHHHHHHSSSSSSSQKMINYQQQLTLPPGTPSAADTLWMSTMSTTSENSASFTSFPPPLTTSSINAQNHDLFSDLNTTQAPQDNCSLNTSPSIESEHHDHQFHNNPSNNQPSIPSEPSNSIFSSPELNQSTQRECVSSELVTSTTNMLFDYPVSPLPGPEKLKLKLSKNQFTSQYSSTITKALDPESPHQQESSLLSPSSQIVGSKVLPSQPPLQPSPNTQNENFISFQSSTLSSPKSTPTLLSPPMTNFDSKNKTSPLLGTADHAKSPTKQSSSRSRSRSRSQSHERNYQSSSSLSPHQSSFSRPRKPKTEKGFIDLLEHLLRQIKRRDPKNFFLYPVTDEIAPGYSTFISSPMDMTTIQRKIDQRHSQPKYLNLGDFIADVKLICDNAMRYNRPETIYYKAASKLSVFTIRLIKKEALVGYAKTYSKCTPLQLSLTPSSSQPQAIQQQLILQHQSTLVKSQPACGYDSKNNIQITSQVPPFSTDFATSVSNSALFEQTSGSTKPSANSNVVTSGCDVDDPLASIDLLSSLSPFRLYDDEEMPFSAGHLPSDFSSLQFDSQVSANPELPPPPVQQKEKKESEMSPEELIASIQESARKAAEKLRSYRGVPRYSYLSRDPAESDSTNSSQLILHTLCTGDIAFSSKAISLKHLEAAYANKKIAQPLVTGNIEALTATETSNQLTTEEEKKMSETGEEANEANFEVTTNNKKTLEEVKIVKKTPLDEMKIREDEIAELRNKLIPTIYDDDDGLNYALSISRFTRNVDNNRLIPIVLNKLTMGKHRKALENFNKLLLLN